VIPLIPYSNSLSSQHICSSAPGIPLARQAAQLFRNKAQQQGEKKADINQFNGVFLADSEKPQLCY
jgi:hypothetical protein